MRAALRSLAAAITLLAAVALSGSASASGISATFDSTNQGFQTVELDEDGLTHNTMPAAYVGSGGNPGGYITFDDPDSGGMERYGLFIAPNHLQPADYGATVSFDLRSTATQLRPSRLGFVTFSFGGFGDGVICVLSAPTASYANYSFTVDADNPCWKRTFSDQDATPADIETALDESGQSFINADFGNGADEVTDLDNFAVQPLEPRELSLKYKAKKKTFAGKLTGAACTSGAEVVLYREGRPDPLAGAQTNSSGKFSIEKKAKRGKSYYAVAPGTEDCAEAESGPVSG